MAMQANTMYKSAYNTLLSIYKSPKYLFLNIAAFIIYYYLYTFIISLQQYGAVIVLIPLYLLYLLVLTSSVTLTIGIYSIGNTRNNEAKYEATGVGTLTALVGAVIGGCNCEAPAIFGLATIGLLSTTGTIALINFISANQIPLYWALIVINLFVAIYYLNKLSQPSCKIRGKRP